MDILFIDFLNSDYNDYKGTGRTEDRLLNKEWQDFFLEKWGFVKLPLLDQKTLFTLQEFRSALRSIVDSLASGETADHAQLQQVAKAMNHSAYVRRLAKHGHIYQLEWHPLQKDWNWVLAEIANSFFQLFTRNEHDRIKVCQNEDCRWVFYDESKNRNRRWCHNVCGNLMKVRRFREKQKASN